MFASSQVSLGLLPRRRAGGRRGAADPGEPVCSGGEARGSARALARRRVADVGLERHEVRPAEAWTGLGVGGGSVGAGVGPGPRTRRR